MLKHVVLLAGLHYFIINLLIKLLTLILVKAKRNVLITVRHFNTVTTEEQANTFSSCLYLFFHFSCSVSLRNSFTKHCSVTLNCIFLFAFCFHFFFQLFCSRLFDYCVSLCVCAVIFLVCLYFDVSYTLEKSLHVL